MNSGIGSYAFRYAIAQPSSMIAKKMTLTRLMDYCHDHKITSLQICDNIPLHQLPDNELQECLNLSVIYGLNLEIGTIGFTYPHLKKYLEIAHFFESKILRTVLKADKFHISSVEFAQEINRVIPILESYNITLAIENHFDLNPCELRLLIENINHPLVKICIDPLNSITRLWGINETFEELKNHIVSAHIKDVRVERKGAGFLIAGCPLGEGVADVQNYLRQIYRANPRCNIFLEQWMDEAQTIPDTINNELKWVENGMDYLKQIIGDLEVNEIKQGHKNN